jgi:hypothetical protein
MPLANERLVVNHCGTIGTEPMKRKPMPRPKHIPWERKSCHIVFAKDAAMRLPLSRMTPVNNVTCVPKYLVVVVARGDISIATEMDKEPTKAYSSGDAPGKTSLSR